MEDVLNLKFIQKYINKNLDLIQVVIKHFVLWIDRKYMSLQIKLQKNVILINNYQNLIMITLVGLFNVLKFHNFVKMFTRIVQNFVMIKDIAGMVSVNVSIIGKEMIAAKQLIDKKKSNIIKVYFILNIQKILINNLL